MAPHNIQSITVHQDTGGHGIREGGGEGIQDDGWGQGSQRPRLSEAEWSWGLESGESLPWEGVVHEQEEIKMEPVNFT